MFFLLQYFSEGCLSEDPLMDVGQLPVCLHIFISINLADTPQAGRNRH